MNLKRVIGTGAIAGALGFSAIGLAGAASAAPAPQPGPGTVQHAQLVHWGGGRGTRLGWPRLPSWFWWTRSDRVGRSAAVPHRPLHLSPVDALACYSPAAGASSKSALSFRR